MSDTTSARKPQLGDVVIYHDLVRQDIFDPSAHVDLPAIVTAVLEFVEGQQGYRVRLTVFRPFDRPQWDISAMFTAESKAHHWSWRDA